MNTAPERFLKYVSLRVPQTLVNEEETKKRNYISPPKGFKSILLTKIEKKKLQTRGEVMKLAKEIYLKLGPVDGLPKNLNENLIDVFKSPNVKSAKEKFADLFGKTIENFLKNDRVKALQYQAWDNYYCLSCAPEKKATTRQYHLGIIKRFYAIGRLEATKNNESLPILVDIQALKPLLPKELFPYFKKKKRSPSKANRIQIEKIKQLLAQLKHLESITVKVKREDKKVHSEDLTKKGKLNPTTINNTNKKTTGTILDVPEPENWLLKRIEYETQEKLKPAQKMFTKEELDLLNTNKTLLYGKSEVDALDGLQKQLYIAGKVLLYHPRQAISAEVANHSATLTVLKMLDLPKQKLFRRNDSLMDVDSETLIHQLGVGDLYVLEQQVNRYEMGEVAHIENVMAKETRERIHTRLNETENTFIIETEETVVDEKSLETTERFELSKETEKQVTSSLDASGGFSVSATYGPVTAGAHGDLSSATSTSRSQTTSTNFAREVVEKSVSKITSRVRKENTTRVLTRVEEINSHGFINDTDKNLCGIYRWVDKYYTVRNINYGRRLMLEMIIPEPASGFLYAEQMHPEHEEIALPPDAINFEPDAISRSNYQDYIAIYGATDVNAPPENIIYKTVSLADTKGDEFTYFVKTDTSVSIDTGYKTTNFYGASSYRFPANSDHYMSILVGGKRFGNTSILDSTVGNLSISVLTKALAYHIGLRIRCELTEQAYQDWQIETWNALQTAYKATVSEYEAKVAAAEIGAGVEIHGRNPGQNEEIIRSELKRGAIKYLSKDMQEIIVNGDIRTNEIFDAADSTGDFDLEEGKIEGSIIQFFEQAFEWTNMMWKFYPYFWARTSEQHQKLLADDPDPNFRDFRRAGAARVVLPVPIVYQDAVLHFFNTNEIWNGGDTPVLNDPEYISIVEDLENGQRNSFNSPIYFQDEDSVPPFIVDEWEIKLPTSLVKLQSDDQLPNFTTSLIETDAETLLDDLALQSSFSEEWRNSILNLLTLLTLSSDEASRRSMASDKGYPNNSQTDVIHNINEWLYDYLLADISVNGLS